MSTARKILQNVSHARLRSFLHEDYGLLRPLLLVFRLHFSHYHFHVDLAFHPDDPETVDLR